MSNLAVTIETSHANMMTIVTTGGAQPGAILYVAEVDPVAVEDDFKKQA